MDMPTYSKGRLTVLKNELVEADQVIFTAYHDNFLGEKDSSINPTTIYSNKLTRITGAQLSMCFPKTERPSAYIAKEWKSCKEWDSSQSNSCNFHVIAESAKATIIIVGDNWEMQNIAYCEGTSKSQIFFDKDEEIAALRRETKRKTVSNQQVSIKSHMRVGQYTVVKYDSTILLATHLENGEHKFYEVHRKEGMNPIHKMVTSLQIMCQNMQSSFTYQAKRPAPALLEIDDFKDTEEIYQTFQALVSGEKGKSNFFFKPLDSLMKADILSNQIEALLEMPDTIINRSISQVTKANAAAVDKQLLDPSKRTKGRADRIIRMGVISPYAL